MKGVLKAGLDRQHCLYINFFLTITWLYTIPVYELLQQFLHHCKDPNSFYPGHVFLHLSYAKDYYRKITKINVTCTCST